MKYTLYILLLNLFFLSNSHGQCTDPDASIWNDTWRSCSPSVNPKSDYGKGHWIMYNFGSVRNLSRTWVWNTNEAGKLEQGFNHVKIDYSLDGETWIHWGDMSFPKAKAEAIYGGFPGPDLTNINAQYILITALSNHGDEGCFGIAEIKFNLMSELGEPQENDDDELQCEGHANIDLPEFVEVEVEMTEAFVFIEEIEEIEDIFLIFEYREQNGNWIEIEVEEEEIELYDLQPGTEYEYRFQIECEDEFYTTESQSFWTIDCQAVSEIYIEEVTENEAFLIWEESDYMEFYLIELWMVEEDEETDIFDVDEAEVFLDDLEESTEYGLRVGVECGEDNVLWSEPIYFTTTMDNISSNDETHSLRATDATVNIFPNPTNGHMTIRIKTQKKDVLNYSISTIDGRILTRNISKLSSGPQDIKIDISNFPNGVYFLSGVTINGRKNIKSKIVKMSE